MKIKNNKGISLMSLVITIFVMITLISTVVVIALKDEGIVKKTREAKEEIENSSIYQSVTESVVTSKNKNGKINEESLRGKLRQIDEEASLAYDSTTSTYTATVKDTTYTIEEYGNITVQE